MTTEAFELVASTTIIVDRLLQLASITVYLITSTTHLIVAPAVLEVIAEERMLIAFAIDVSSHLFCCFELTISKFIISLSLCES